MSVLAPGAANLWLNCEARGLDPRPIFAAEGLEIALPFEPGKRLSYRAVDRVRARAAALSGAPDFGLGAGPCLHPTQLGALGYAWTTCSSLRQAFGLMSRYIRVLNDAGSFTVTETKGELVASLEVAQDSLDLDTRSDTQMSMLVGFIRLICGRQFNPRWIEMNRSQPADPGPWKAQFRCPVRFGCVVNRLAVSVEDADRPLAGGDPLLEKIHEQLAERRLASLERDRLTHRAVQVMLQQLPTGQLTDETVANALHMTSRTLHRRLKLEGETFRGLLKTLRQDLAEQYILDKTLTLTEITFLLGFSEMSSFSRAYKHWTGMAPSEAREGGGS